MNKLYEDFPRVAPVAESYGFTYENVVFLLDKMKSDTESVDLYGEDGLEVTLRTILLRLDMNKKEFMRHLFKFKGIEWDINSLHAATERVGIRSLVGYVALLK